MHCQCSTSIVGHWISIQQPTFPPSPARLPTHTLHPCYNHHHPATAPPPAPSRSPMLYIIVL